MAKFCVAGIVRNEVDYLVEWVAWHRLAGFGHVILADNGSDDGTRSLLEALADLGEVSLLYQPVLERRSQQLAYRRILGLALGKHDYVMFLDADEFLVHESQRHGEECRELERLVASGDVGSVSVNWKCFGSSGLEEARSEPVLQRFTRCGTAPGASADCHTKSLVRVDHVKAPYCHSSTLVSAWKYVDATGDVIEDFVGSPDGSGESDPRGGRTRSIHQGPLRVHHYAVKSREEFSRKRLRGSATRGANFDKGEAYFGRYDINDVAHEFQAGKLARLAREMSALKQRLAEHTVLDRPLVGAIDHFDANAVCGWVTDRNGKASGLAVNIFVNGVHAGRARVGFYRPDLRRSGKSVDGYCGFRWLHPAPLKEGDHVTASLHANASVLVGGSDLVVGTS